MPWSWRAPVFMKSRSVFPSSFSPLTARCQLGRAVARAAPMIWATVYDRALEPVIATESLRGHFALEKMILALEKDSVQLEL